MMTDKDLISRAAAIEYLMTNMGWNDDDGYAIDDADEKRAIITDLVNGIPAVDAITVEWLREKMKKPMITSANPFDYVLDEWEQENNPSPTCGPDYCDID